MLPWLSLGTAMLRKTPLSKNPPKARPNPIARALIVLGEKRVEPNKSREPLPRKRKHKGDTDDT